MIIVKENTDLKEGTENVRINDFIKLVGRKRECQLDLSSKSGVMEIQADNVICGFENSFFYIREGDLCVFLKTKAICLVTVSRNDTIPDDYAVFFMDGTRITMSIN